MNKSPRLRVPVSQRPNLPVSTRHLLVSLSPLLLVCVLAGCAQDQTDLQSALNQSTATLAQAQLRQSQLTQTLSTRPSDDPARQTLQPQLDRLDQFITQLQSQLPKLDNAIKSNQTAAQPLDPTLQQTLSTLPYGSLAVALLGLTFGALKHFQTTNLLSQHQQSQKAFQQIVQALDAALPTPTPDQQAKVNAALDADIKAKLAAARA